MRLFPLLILVGLGLTACQVPLSSPSSSGSAGSGLTLTLGYTVPQNSGSARLLLPTAGFAVVTLTDSSGKVQTQSQSLTTQFYATFSFPSVSIGTYTISAKAYSDPSLASLLFAQQKTVSFTAGTNQLALPLLPTVFTTWNGTSTPVTVPANSTVSFKYLLTNAANNLLLAGLPAAAVFLQNSAGDYVAGTPPAIGSGATDGTLYITFYNPTGSSVSSAGMTLTETSSAVPTTFTVASNGVYLSGSALASHASVSFKYSLTSVGDFVTMSGLAGGLTYYFQKSTGAPVVDTAGVVAANATDGTLYLTLYNPTASPIAYSLTKLTETAPVLVASVFTSPSSIPSLPLGGAANTGLMLHFTNSPTNPNVVLSSTNPAVATVSPAGPIAGVPMPTITVTPIGVGVANIIITAVDGSGAFCSIPVSVGLPWTYHSLSYTYVAVTFGAGKFIAVGTNVAATSTDGVTWVPQTIPAGTWTSVAYGGTGFVAVASGTSSVVTSPDGVTWSPATSSPPTSTWSSITYGAGLFLMTSTTSTSAYSTTNGTTWSSSTNLAGISSTGLGSMAFGGGRFVGVDEGTSLSSANGYSADGVSWSPGGSLPTISYPPESATSVWGSVAYGNGMFVATVPEVGGSGGTSAAFSTNGGSSWTSTTLPAGNWTSISFGNGVFVLMAINGSASASTAPNGGATAWSNTSGLLTGGFSPVVYGNGKFVTVGTYSGGPYSMTSP